MCVASWIFKNFARQHMVHAVNGKNICVCDWQLTLTNFLNQWTKKGAQYACEWMSRENESVASIGTQTVFTRIFYLNCNHRCLSVWLWCKCVCISAIFGIFDWLIDWLVGEYIRPNKWGINQLHARVKRKRNKTMEPKRCAGMQLKLSTSLIYTTQIASRSSLERDSRCNHD